MYTVFTWGHLHTYCSLYNLKRTTFGSPKSNNSNIWVTEEVDTISIWEWSHCLNGRGYTTYALSLIHISYNAKIYETLSVLLYGGNTSFTYTNITGNFRLWCYNHIIVVFRLNSNGLGRDQLHAEGHSQRPSINRHRKRKYLQMSLSVSYRAQ